MHSNTALKLLHFPSQEVLLKIIILSACLRVCESVCVFDSLVWQAMYIPPKLRGEVGKLTLYVVCPQSKCTDFPMYELAT